MSLVSLIVTGLAVVGVLSAEDCSLSNCNTGLIKYYKELNCVPVQEPGACCPSKFDCSAALANRSDNKCHVKGQSYDVGAILTSEQVGDNCIPECRCLNPSGEEASLQCVHGECPDLFTGPPAPGCVQLYSQDHCCSVGTHCKNETKPAAKEDFKCEHGGESYIVGQKFWPKEKPCLACICQQEYDGTLNGPWCSEISCGIELHYASKLKQGCAPIHFGKNDCCPIGFRCPNSSDTVQNGLPATKKDAPECVFGKLRLKVSEALNLEKECVVCSCEVPPYVSCVQNGYC